MTEGGFRKHSSQPRPFRHQGEDAHFQIQTAYQQRGQGGEVWSVKGEMGESDEGQRGREAERTKIDRRQTEISHMHFIQVIFKASF